MQLPVRGGGGEGQILNWRLADISNGFCRSGTGNSIQSVCGNEPSAAGPFRSFSRARAIIHPARNIVLIDKIFHFFPSRLRRPRPGTPRGDLRPPRPHRLNFHQHRDPCPRAPTLLSGVHVFNCMTLKAVVCGQVQSGRFLRRIRRKEC